MQNLEIVRLERTKGVELIAEEESGGKFQFSKEGAGFILPKLLLKEKDLYTVAVGLMSLGDTEFSRFAAGSVFIAVPIVILYFCLMKFLINGMTAGAVKG